MKGFILTTFVVVLALATPGFGQQAGTNVNVLPVVPELTPGDPGWDPEWDPEKPDPIWWKLGDGYLQRQVEPTIGASTLNPDHLLAFFNDYRAVDVVEGDVGLGEGELASAALKLARILLPPPISSALPMMELVPPINAAEAWIGGSRSYDGGYTWSGFFLPGAPWDDSPASQSAPIYGLEAATDPVLATGPCGTYYLAFVAFTRGGQSKITVARYNDVNNFEGGDSTAYGGMTVIESGNNAEYGYFLDKPDIEVDLMREEGADQCAHRVFVTYSTFNGLTKDQKVQTKMNFAMSIDGGITFTTTKINKNFNQNQGSAIAVDPRPGTPKGTGGGTVYVFWRHFFDPDAIVVRRSLDYGTKWSNPAILTGDPALVPFDQPTISTNFAATPASPLALNDGFPELAFRSNGFPTAAVSPYVLSDGGTPTDETDDVWGSTVFVAWQERLDDDGFPNVNGDPGIVMMRSDDEGGSWTGFDASSVSGTVGDRRAVDKEQRFEPFDPYFPMPSPEDDPAWKFSRYAGGQVQPKLSIGGGRLMLTFYESRGRIGNYGTPLEYMASEPWDSVDYTAGITGYDRVVDFRATLLDPIDGNRWLSTQISRYPIRLGANLDDGQDLSDLAAINAPCFPDSGVFGNPICVRQINRVNAPTSAAGTSPFIGDYPDTVPYVQFVPDGSGNWRWAIRPSDVPSRGFHAIWTDNRHLIPPTEVPSAPSKELPDTVDEWEAYQFYGPPSIGGACLNPGSRNTDVLTSRVATDVIVAAPTTFKQLDRPRSFPFSITNKTGEFRRFELAITSDIANGTNYATFSPRKDEFGDYVNQDTYTVIVFPYSNSSLTVYVTPPENDPDPTKTVGTILVGVTLLETTTDPILGTDITSEPGDWNNDCTEDCMVGTIAFNAYPDNEEVQRIAGTEEDFGPEISTAFVINWFDTETPDPNTAFVINNFLDNAFVINAFVINNELDNAFVINDGLDNAFVINPTVQNAFVINRTDPLVYSITDTVWTMTPGNSNTAATYVPLPNIDNAEQLVGGDNPAYAFQLIVDKNSAYGSVDECASYNVAQQQVLANVIQNPADPNAFVINDFVKNAFVINSEVQNAFVINSAFTMPPSNGGSATKSTMANHIPDGETRAAPPDSQVRITLRAFQLVHDDELPRDRFTGKKISYNPEFQPASIALFHQGCDHTDPNEECITKIGADLVIQSVDLDLVPPYVYPYDDLDNFPEPPELDPVGRCGTFDFPGFTLSNIGNADAIPRGEIMRHGVFLSTNLVLDIDDDRLLTPPLDNDIQSNFNPLAGKFDPDPDPELVTEEPFGTTEITLPPDVPAGVYYLILMADYPTDTSEYDETNNTVALKLVVNDTGGSDYIFAGGPPLVFGSVATANAGSALPLLWQYLDPITKEPFDSVDAYPVVEISGWTETTCGSQEGDPQITIVEDPGSSYYRYKESTFTHQFNWQTKEDGSPLPPGCYGITITNSYLCGSQGDGPFLVQLN